MLDGAWFLCHVRDSSSTNCAWRILPAVQAYIVNGAAAGNEDGAEHQLERRDLNRLISPFGPPARIAMDRGILAGVPGAVSFGE